jgi:hypothetical protein
MHPALAPPGLMVPAPHMDRKPGAFLHQDMAFPNYPYADYFDMSAEEHFKYKPQPMLNGVYPGHTPLELDVRAQKHEDLFSPSAFLTPGARPVPTSTDMQSCMYTTLKGSDQQQQQKHGSAHSSPTSAGTSGLGSSMDMSRNSSGNESYLTGHPSPAPEPHFENKQVFDDFEVNDPSDIFFDQPLNKDCVVASKMAEKLQGGEKPATSTASSSCNGGSSSNALDFSALLGLPSITSFLDDEQENKKSEVKEEPDLSPACSRSSPPHLIELQPLGAGSPHSTAGPRCSDHSPAPSRAGSAFQPYASEQGFPAPKDPAQGRPTPYAFDCFEPYEAYNGQGVYRNATM